MKITIPASLDEAKASLNGIGALLTAKEWERAAIVYAFTRDGTDSDKNPRRSRSTTSLLPREFAALGIMGLGSDTTVRQYRKAWQTAIDDGQAKAVQRTCPHCAGPTRCNDRDGLIAAYMERVGRGTEWRDALRRQPRRSGEK